MSKGRFRVTVTPSWTAVEEGDTVRFVEWVKGPEGEVPGSDASRAVRFAWFERVPPTTPAGQPQYLDVSGRHAGPDHLLSWESVEPLDEEARALVVERVL